MILAASGGQMKQGDVTTVPLVTLGATGAQMKTREVSAVSLADGVTEAMLVNRGTA
jgi:hypothetical protein